MIGFRFSTKGVLIAVTLVAVGAFTLMSDSRPWIIAVGSGTGLVLLTALLAVVCRPSPRRAFWLGFAIFGWAYLLLTFAANTLVAPTIAANELLYDIISREDAHGRRMPPEPYFEYVCELAWTWLLAVVGGFAARHFYVAQVREPPDRQMKGR